MLRVVVRTEVEEVEEEKEGNRLMHATASQDWDFIMCFCFVYKTVMESLGWLRVQELVCNKCVDVGMCDAGKINAGSLYEQLREACA